MENEHTQQAVNAVTKETKTTRLNVADIEWLQNAAGDGESPAAALSRLHEELISLRARCCGYEAEVMSLRAENDVLQEGVDRLGSSRSIVPEQTVISDFGGEVVKDTMDAIKDVCDDEAVCVKTALHMIDTKADVMNKQLDRDHSRTEKAKDRDHLSEEKAKDRQLKQDLEASRVEHQKNLALIKKGVVKEADLEDVVFLGSMEKRKTAGERLAEMKRRAYHAADGDDDDECLELVDDGESGYGDVGHEDLEHV
ncbi:MAG: hypothetical protein U9R15_01405 [Chloroflexota bacterium]|nr:hypothetical protein [Chloroflexota bacterium]